MKKIKATTKEVKIAEAKGRPMLHWVGKKPLSRLSVFPAQLVETFIPKGAEKDEPNLLFHGDNKEVLTWLLANGYRGKVDLIYIDPPFNTGLDNYVRRVKLRGIKVLNLAGEEMSIVEQAQYANNFLPDTFLQFLYERLQLLGELLTQDGVIVTRIDYHYTHYLKIILDEMFSGEFFVNEIIIARQRENVGSTNKLEVVYESIFVYSKSPNFFFQKPKVHRSVANIQWTAFLMGGERNPRERTFLGVTLTPPAEQHFSLKQEKVNKLVSERFLRLRCKECSALHYYGPSQKELERYMRKKENRFKFYDLNSDKIYFGVENIKKCSSCGKQNFVADYLGSDEETVRNDWTDIPSYSQRTGYPTENSEELLERVIETYSKPNSLLLDCFIGSGTTAAVAQKLGRKWIACDINKGAIQTTSKRLQAIIEEQMEEANGKTVKPEIEPVSRSFIVQRVNDYDLQIQHNEAMQLAVECIGITRTKEDSFFEGTLGTELAKIVPLQHPCTLLDIQLIADELKKRSKEERDIVIVCLGKESAVDVKVEEWNKLHPINKLRIIELRTDNKYGKFFEHKPCKAKVKIERKGRKLTVKVEDFLSPTIIERLQTDGGLLQPKIEDWRSMVDCVLIDTDYDGKVFNIHHSDVPEKKQDLVDGSYALEVPTDKKRTVAVKIIDMLGEELLIAKEV